MAKIISISDVKSDALESLIKRDWKRAIRKRNEFILRKTDRFKINERLDKQAALKNL